MKLLLIHSDDMEYSIKKKTSIAEDIDDTKKHMFFDHVLVVFISIEKDDILSIENTVKKATDEILKTIDLIKEKNILLYPYAHLSSNLASKDNSLLILNKLETSIINEKNNINVKRSPFGWYKSFSIKCKGHPLSELSKHIISNSKEEINEDSNISDAVKIESSIKSNWFILDEDNILKNVNDYNYKNHEKLKQFVDYEVSKNRVCDEVPPHVEYMRTLEIADYENGSDSGNMRFYPKGRFIKSLIEKYIVDQTKKEYGAMEVETPLMYNMNHPTLKKYLNRFPARQYSINSDKKNLFLRFAACFGQFLMMHDMTISYKDLPLKMIELTRYSFRREQRGELVGLRRLRAFTMPDMHTLTEDMNNSKSEFLKQYLFCIKTIKNIGFENNDFEIAIRFTKQFYELNKDMIMEIVSIIKKPVLVEIWESRFFYFVLKFELNFIDNIRKASALSTVQIDVENAERYDIKYTNNDGKLKYPIILHCSPSGAIERCIYALLEKAHFDKQNNKLPSLPLWLSPTQVRIIPVSLKYITYCEKILNIINYRVDIDDREITLNKKIRDAGREWIPFTIIIGEKEINNNNINVIIRSMSTLSNSFNKEMSIDELNDLIKNKTKDYPYMSLPLQKYLSKRPKFV